MSMGGINGFGKAQTNAAGKPSGSKDAETPEEQEAASATQLDALTLGAVKGTARRNAARQLAKDFAKKFARFKQLMHDPEAYEDLADEIGTPTYVWVDTVTRLCRDTQDEPLEDRLATLRVIQHTVGLPDDMAAAIEEDLRKTSR